MGLPITDEDARLMELCKFKFCAITLQILLLLILISDEL